MQRTLLVFMLILIGLAALLELTGIAPGAGVLAIPFFVLLLAALILQRAMHPSTEARSVTALNIPAGPGPARLEIIFGAGHLVLSGGADTGLWVSGEAHGALTQQTGRDGTLRLGQPFSLLGRARADWRLALGAAPWQRVRIEAASSQVELDLSALDVETLVLECGAATLNARLPRRGEVSLQVSGGRSVLVVPAGTPAVITSLIRLGEAEVDQAHFSPGGALGSWVTPGFTDGPGALHVTLKGGLGKVEVRGE